jgi:hypothetical protein
MKPQNPIQVWISGIRTIDFIFSALTLSSFDRQCSAWSSDALQRKIISFRLADNWRQSSINRRGPVRLERAFAGCAVVFQLGNECLVEATI